MSGAPIHWTELYIFKTLYCVGLSGSSIICSTCDLHMEYNNSSCRTSKYHFICVCFNYCVKDIQTCYTHLSRRQMRLCVNKVWPVTTHELSSCLFNTASRKFACRRNCQNLSPVVCGWGLSRCVCSPYTRCSECPRRWDNRSLSSHVIIFILRRFLTLYKLDTSSFRVPEKRNWNSVAKIPGVL